MENLEISEIDEMLKTLKSINNEVTKKITELEKIKFNKIYITVNNIFDDFDKLKEKNNNCVNSHVETHQKKYFTL
jgi:uncharacterized coiled-coil DUF342 family protein